MEEKSLRTNKLTHLFETLLQQEEQERQHEQEQEEKELEQELEQRSRFAMGGARMMGFEKKKSIGSGKKRSVADRESLRFGQSEWSAEAVSCLLDCYAEKYASGRGYLRNTDWEEVVSTVNAREGMRDRKTMKQCRDKVDSLKKRYKLEKRKAVDSGSSVVSWPLYGKLDDMMTFQSRVARIPGGVDAGVKVPYPEPSHHDLQLDFPEEFGYDLPFRKKGKMSIDDADGLSDEGFNKQHSSRTGTQESLDEGSHSHSRKGFEQQTFSNKGKAKAVDPTESYVEQGFSEVFARIEMAKADIIAKMTQEIAQLERNC